MPRSGVKQGNRKNRVRIYRTVTLPDGTSARRVVKDKYGEPVTLGIPYPPLSEKKWRQWRKERKERRQLTEDKAAQDRLDSELAIRQR